MKNKAIFLDRDGVINRALVVEGKSYAPTAFADFELIDGVAEACTLLKNAGFLLVVVTNQPDVATGKQSKEVVEQMHKYIQLKLGLDDIQVCFHTDETNCACRKPKPGMLYAAAKTHNIDLKQSFIVGDRWRDVEAGLNSGVTPIFINYNYSEKQPTGQAITVNSLKEAAHWILKA